MCTMWSVYVQFLGRDCETKAAVGGVHSLGRGGLLPPGAFDVLSPHSSITAGVCAY